MVPALPIWSKSSPTSISSGSRTGQEAPPRTTALKLLAVLDAARDIVDRLLEVVAPWEARTRLGRSDVTRDAEEAGSAVALRAELGIGFAAH